MSAVRAVLFTMVVVGSATSLAGGRPAQADQRSNDIAAFFAAYDAAFVAKDLDRLAAMYHPDVTIYEGGGVNTGWADYRDHHLGPELRSFSGLKFTHSNVQAQPLGSDAAYVTSEYAIETTTSAGTTKGGGLETDILVRQNGHWLIRHTHTSARRQRPGLN